MRNKTAATIVLAAALSFLALTAVAAFAEDVVSPAAMDKLAKSKNAKPAAKKKAAPAKAAKPKLESAVEKVESLTLRPEKAPLAAPKAAPPKREPPKPSGPEYNYILFESKPSNAEVVLDGYYMGVTPMELPVRDGPHEVQLSYPGYVGWNRKIMTFAGFRIFAALEEAKEAKPTEAPKP